MNCGPRISNTRTGDLLIVYKRGGVPVQPTPYSDIDNLLHGVQDVLRPPGASRTGRRPSTASTCRPRGWSFSPRTRRARSPCTASSRSARSASATWPPPTPSPGVQAFLYHPLGAGVAGEQQDRADLRPLLPRKRRPLLFSGVSPERAHPPDPPPFPGAGARPWPAMSAMAGAGRRRALAALLPLFVPPPGHGQKDSRSASCPRPGGRPWGWPDTGAATG